MKYSEMVKDLEYLVNIPSYSIIGKLKDSIILESVNQGESNISAIKDNKITRLTEGVIANPAKPKSTLNYLPFTRDIEKGKEIHSIYIANLNGEEYEILSPKLRITSIAYNEEIIAYTGSSPKESALYIIENDEPRKLANIPSFAFVTDISKDYIIGFGNMVGNRRSREFFITDLNGNIKTVTPKEGSQNLAYFIRDNFVYLTSDYENSNGSYWAYTYDIENSHFKRIEFPGKDIYNYNPMELIYDPESSLSIAKSDGESKLFYKGKLLKTPRGMINGATRIENDIYFSISSLISPPKIYKMDENGKSRIIVNNRNIKLGSVRFKKLKSDVEIPVWEIKSAKSRKPGITIIYVHGGPWDEVSNSWDLFLAPLVKLGYHVIAPNFRGSTGYGSSYMNLDVGDPGGGDLKDVLEARNYALQSGLANKVGIMGYSYGGYMTLLAVGKIPDKWAFGIAGASAPDWVEMYDLSDSFLKGFIDLLFSGHNPDLMKERSPITYVKNVNVPLCLIQSQNDTTTPLKPILDYIKRLSEEGKVYEFHTIPNLGHGIYRVSDAVDILLPAILFLERINEK